MKFEDFLSIECSSNADLRVFETTARSILMHSSVCVTVVTHNSRPYLEACLRSLFEQNFDGLEIVIVDNASTDGTRGILARFEDRMRVFYNNDNVGFSAGQNQAIRACTSEWVLVLNPDVVLAPRFIEQLVEYGGMDESAGSICGRLLAIGPDLQQPDQPLIDSAGIYFTPAMRHFDRGWHEPDDGRYRKPEYVFGASAAAAMYRRAMIADISQSDEFFDPDFFAYREDADVAWRAQLLGWKCLYAPDAVAYHVRSVWPGNRRIVPHAINMHSVKNRFLLRFKNMGTGLFRRFWGPATARDLLVIGGCVFWEPTSLPAFWHLFRSLPRALRRRRWIMARRRVSDGILARWFQPEPAAQPVNPAKLPVRCDKVSA